MIGLRPFSVVVPVHNEAAILEACLSRMLRDLKSLVAPFELVACENGSSDGTLALARTAASAHSEIRVEVLAQADYGAALRRGILASTHDVVVVFNIDFWDVEFARTAIPLLEDYDLVVGSKNTAGSHDSRPLLRRLITRGFNGFLRVAFGFRGTDTHGLKVLRREVVLPILDECVTDHFVFDTELMLRAEGQGFRITELPVSVTELRAPSYLALAKRAPRVLRNLVKLRAALRTP